MYYSWFDTIIDVFYLHSNKLLDGQLYIYVVFIYLFVWPNQRLCMSKSAHGLTGMYLHFTATATSLYLFTHYSDCRISTSPVYQFNIKTCGISQNRNPHVFHYCITDFALWNCNLILSLNDGTRAGFLPDNFSFFFCFFFTLWRFCHHWSTALTN